MTKTIKKAIIIGATSGLGRGLAQILLQQGYSIGITGRRRELLLELKEQYGERVAIASFDVCNTQQNIQNLQNLINELGGVDLFIFSSGIGFINNTLEWKKEEETIHTNITGFTQLIDFAFTYFAERKEGHIVGISSIASQIGSKNAPAYNASKAYQVNYLKGLRIKSVSEGLNIHVTDIRPGFVDTRMAIGSKLFWVASVEKASLQIYKAIKNKKKRVYVTKRWWIVASFLRILPEGLFIRNRKS